ncbi:hypothetical protein QBC99_002259 [Beijerinckia sp. GAS462]|nr:hypothetical protein [Beijerinckia sp. GAS462]SEC34524.1 hypothetical protein SAMN05443249_2478 [Beijerinckia sp. 28-YEA-48]
MRGLATSPHQNFYKFAWGFSMIAGKTGNLTHIRAALAFSF